MASAQNDDERQALTQALRRLGAESDGDAATRYEALARVLWERALTGGDLAAARLIFEYVEGKPAALGGAELRAAIAVGVATFTADELAQAAAGLRRWEGERRGDGDGDEEEQGAGNDPGGNAGGAATG